MIETLKSFGWYLLDKSNCGSCGTGPKERWGNGELPGVTVTVLFNANMFVVRREKRVIHQDYAGNLFTYLTQIV